MKMNDEYQYAASVDDCKEGELFAVELGEASLLLARVGGELHAFDAICTHGNGYLEDGGLEGCEVICPLHMGAFDVRDGKPTPARPGRLVRGAKQAATETRAASE